MICRPHWASQTSGLSGLLSHVCSLHSLWKCRELQDCSQCPQLVGGQARTRNNPVWRNWFWGWKGYPDQISIRIFCKFLEKLFTPTLVIDKRALFQITKAGIKVNPRKLYASSVASAKELLKITSVLIHAPNDVKAQEDEVKSINEIDLSDRVRVFQLKHFWIY